MLHLHDAASRRDSPPAAGHAGAAPALQIQLLGGFRLAVGGRVIEQGAWRSLKALNLVKLLALAPGHQLTRDQLVDYLWPDLDPKAGVNNLHQALHVARRVLAPLAAALDLRQGVVALRPPGECWIDVDAFESAAAATRHAEEPAACQRAAALYTGDLLPEDRYEDWVAPRREALRDAYLDLLATLARLQEARCDYPAAIATLQCLLAHEPALEDAHAGLMRLYALSGQRQQALRQYARLREALRRELDVEPEPASQGLYATILARRFPPAAPSPAQPPPGARRHNLPIPLTSLVGRGRETAELATLLAPGGHGPRLVTLVGAGGCGKSRLALAAAAGLARDCRDGAWLVELAALTDPALVPGAVAGVLGAHEEPGRPLADTLADTVRAKQLLLVLDNCEHLADAVVALATHLLSAAPELRVLATSRAPLRGAGELIWRVPSLPVPPAGDAAHAREPESLVAIASVQLFVERARLADPAFALTERNAAAVAEVCRRLEGIPLALELAAARVALLTVEQLAARLDDALGMLTGGTRTAPPRHQTLRAALDWSHGLLDAGGRALLRRLAVFAGGWTLEAAEALGAGLPGDPAQGERPAPEAVLDLLAQLVDQSLAQVEARAGEARYRLLEPVRQYALERLAASGEERALRDRHAAHYLALAAAAEPRLVGPEQGAWLDRLERDHANLRAALAWYAHTQPTLGLRLAGHLWEFWQVRGHRTEGRQTLAALLAAAPEPTPARARALLAAGVLAIEQEDRTGAQALLEESLTLARAHGDQRECAWALLHLGYLDMWSDDLALAQARYAESAALFHQVNDRRGGNWALLYQGFLARMQGDHQQTRALWEECLGGLRELGDRRGTGVALGNLARLAWMQADYERAGTLLEDGLALHRAVGNKAGIGWVLGDLGNLARIRGDFARARTLLEESLAVYDELGDRRMRGVILHHLGKLALDAGAADEARARYAASLALYRATDAARSTARVLGDLAQLAGRDGDLAQAQTLWRECLAHFRDAGTNRWGIGWALGNLGVLAIRQQAYARGVRLIAGAEAVNPQFQSAIDPDERDECDAALAAARSALGDDAFTQAWAAGRAMTQEQAIACALAGARPRHEARASARIA